ncbi:hypothetical protein AKJ66_01530 [candidate division MSBL1 archaeon SCGC-AAA259E22]|uniref:Transcription regulator PadR N-terminal domain-containing protein n=1 Tax=candidate division MSBL1 archaeon SCGC-AAA259E22 TaxID=1698265 RepID=A0A133UHK3_9EURY|nr:hypothetical protein AKJ66_01530 [candidate division MSBL1 archaeon SCGC-AAA259E22]
MKAKPKGKYQQVPFYKLVLRYLAVRDRKVTSDEIYLDWCKDYNDKGVSDSNIRRVLKMQEERGTIRSERYDNGKRGPNPKRYWITEVGKRNVAYHWNDLEYDEASMELRQK